MQESDVFVLIHDGTTISDINDSSCPPEVEVPSSITKIDKRAFADCPVKTVAIPESVTEIGYEAFAGCDALEAVRLPNNLESLGMAAFRGCLSLTDIKISESIVKLPENIFECCYSLAKIPIDSNIMEIGHNAFSECVALENVELPDGLLVIRSGAFGYCENLSTLVLPSTIRLIEDEAFQYCKNLSSIALRGENPVFFVDEDSGCLFERRDDGELTLIKVPVGVEEIRLPKTVTRHHTEAFHGCSALKKIYIDCEFVDHPLFVALKTEVVADIIDETQIAVDDSVEDATEAGAEEAPSFDEALAIEEALAVEEASDTEADEEEIPNEELMIPVPAIEDEPVIEEIGDVEDTTEADAENVAVGDSVEDTTEADTDEAPSFDDAPTSDDALDTEAFGGSDLLSEILGQNAASESEEQDDDDELAGILITPEEFDAAVMRGIQEEEETEYKIPEGVLPSSKEEEDTEPPPPQETRFVIGMQSVCEHYEVISEQELYPDRAPEECCAPIELEDISTLIVVTEALDEAGGISDALKKYAADLARENEIKRVYFFGALGLDNDEFLYGFKQFALYRNVIYAAKAGTVADLSAEIKSFAEIAEIQTPEPFQNAAAPNALSLEMPFKILVQDNFGEAVEVAQVQEESPLVSDNKEDEAPYGSEAMQTLTPVEAEQEAEAGETYEAETEQELADEPPIEEPIAEEADTLVEERAEEFPQIEIEENYEIEEAAPETIEPPAPIEKSQLSKRAERSARTKYSGLLARAIQIKTTEPL